jgi:hypothetical protein
MGGIPFSVAEDPKKVHVWMCVLLGVDLGRETVHTKPCSSSKVTRLTSLKLGYAFTWPSPVVLPLRWVLAIIHLASGSPA